jgi:YhcN/YlaJ family sporulation lipoprotein
MILSTALLAGTLLTGCGAANKANNAANNAANNGMRNVTYNANQAKNNVANNVNNYNNNNNNANYRNYTVDSRTANQISNQVNKIRGVRYAGTLINGNTVVVGVHTTAGAPSTPTLHQKVRNIVQKYVGNRNVQVVTDEKAVKRITTVGNKITNGTATREITSDIRGIFNDLGNAVQRPFQNNAR